MLEDAIDLKRIAEECELSGGGIINVVRYASLMALRNGANGAKVIRLKDVIRGIPKEFQKDGKTL